MTQLAASFANEVIVGYPKLNGQTETVIASKFICPSDLKAKNKALLFSSKALHFFYGNNG
jgi:acetyl-CoA carboxylase carboxyltransferase component